MIEPYRQGDLIMIPRRAEGPDAVGIGWVAVLPTDPEYGEWDRYLQAKAGTGVEPPKGDWVRRLAANM